MGEDGRGEHSEKIHGGHSGIYVNRVSKDMSTFCEGDVYGY